MSYFDQIKKRFQNSNLLILDILCIIFCVVVGMMSGYGIETGKSTWYMPLKKSGYNPPSYVFGPVWTLLYTLMGLGLSGILQNKSKIQLGLFIVQLIANVIWTPLFFKMHKIGWALLDIGLLWFSVLCLVISLRKQKYLMALFIPYLAWVSFASFLNFSIYQMN